MGDVAKTWKTTSLAAEGVSIFFSRLNKTIPRSFNMMTVVSSSSSEMKSDGSIYFTGTDGIQPGWTWTIQRYSRVSPDLTTINLVARGYQFVNGLI